MKNKRINVTVYVRVCKSRQNRTGASQTAAAVGIAFSDRSLALTFVYSASLEHRRLTRRRKHKKWLDRDVALK